MASGDVSFEKGPHMILISPSVENCTSSCFRDYICDFLKLRDEGIIFSVFLKSVSLIPQMSLGVMS